MSAHSSTALHAISQTISAHRATLWRAGAGIALLAATALWLWALPALVMRDGFVIRDGACAQAGYRDPVTGRHSPAPPTRLARQEPCLSATSGARP